MGDNVLEKAILIIFVLACVSFMLFCVTEKVELNLPSEVIESDDFSNCSDIHIEKRFGSLIVNCKEAK